MRAAALQKYISYIQVIRIITAFFKYAEKSALFDPQNALNFILLSFWFM